MAIDLHRLAEERSIAYHRVIAARMAVDPSILEQARRRVHHWLACAEVPPYYALAWDEILGGDPRSIAEFLVDRGEHARELRQSSPFAGALTARERWQIWRREGADSDSKT